LQTERFYQLEIDRASGDAPEGTVPTHACTARTPVYCASDEPFCSAKQYELSSLSIRPHGHPKPVSASQLYVRISQKDFGDLRTIITSAPDGSYGLACLFCSAVRWHVDGTSALAIVPRMRMLPSYFT
jgi:hypothetical protein